MVWPLSVSLISSPALRSHPFFCVTWFSPCGHPATWQTWAASSCLGPKAFSCIFLVKEYVFLQDSLCPLFHVAHFSWEKLSLAALSKNIPPYPCHPLIPMTLIYIMYSLVAQLVKNPPAMWKTWVRSLAWEDSLEKGKSTHSSILAWRIPQTLLSDFHFHFSHLKQHLFTCSPFLLLDKQLKWRNFNCFLLCYISGTLSSVWHPAGTQSILMEWINEEKCCWNTEGNRQLAGKNQRSLHRLGGISPGIWSTNEFAKLGGMQVGVGGGGREGWRLFLVTTIKVKAWYMTPSLPLLFPCSAYKLSASIISRRSYHWASCSQAPTL